MLMQPRRYTLSRLLHDDAGYPSEAFVTDLSEYLHIHRHVTDPRTTYLLLDNLTGARRMLWINPLTAVIEQEMLAPKRFETTADINDALAFAGVQLVGAA